MDDLAPQGYTVGIHIRFASPLYLKSTYPQDWQDAYAANNYSLCDPIVLWGIGKSGKTRWSEIPVPDPFDIFGKAASYGLTYGAVVSCGKITSRTIVGVARSDREFTDPEISAFEEIAIGLHDVTEPPTDLTPGMIGALRLLAAGLRPSAVAAELEMSEDALEARLLSAQTKLGARTRAEAVRMAKEFRLL